MEWTPEIVQRLIKMWTAGIPASQIGQQLGYSRSAVLGKAHRIGLRVNRKIDGKAVQEPALTRPAPSRRGQVEFRMKVLEAYRSQCAITGSTQTETLEAAHIIPWSMTQSQKVRNGICLRKDIHALFDCGLISLSTNYCVMISPRLTDHIYTALRDRQISLPIDKNHHPNLQYIDWHNRNVFKDFDCEESMSKNENIKTN